MPTTRITNAQVLTSLEQTNARVDSLSSKFEQFMTWAQASAPAAQDQAQVTPPATPETPASKPAASKRNQAQRTNREAAKPKELVPDFLTPDKRHNTYEPATLEDAKQLVHFRIYDGGLRAHVIFDGGYNSAYKMAKEYLGIPVDGKTSTEICNAVYAALGVKFAQNRGASLVETAQAGKIRLVVKLTPVGDGNKLTDTLVNRFVYQALRTS